MAEEHARPRRAPSAGDDPFDAGIRAAVFELNRLPGGATRSSCQGKTSPSEASTHADLAYVLFRRPMPLSLEEHLLHEVGGVARIEPTAIYSRWPERNGELCARLAAAVTSFSVARQGERWRERRLPVKELLRPIEALLAEKTETPLDWCLDCDAVIGRGEHGSQASLELVPRDPERSLELFRSFVAADDRPLDGRLLARAGERAVRGRVERGDFGDGYRRAWKRAVAEASENELLERVRERFARARAAGAAVDVYFPGEAVVLARRTSGSRLAPRAGS